MVYEFGPVLTIAFSSSPFSTVSMIYSSLSKSITLQLSTGMRQSITTYSLAGHGSTSG